MRRWTGLLAAFLSLALLAGGVAWLRDPPWLADITTGMREWKEDEGVRFRWTNGHASFFVPSDAEAIVLSLRAVFPAPDGGPVYVAVTADDRWLKTLRLDDPGAWARAPVQMPRLATGRRHRRIDLRVSRTIGEGNLGVELGAVEIDRARGARPQTKAGAPLRKSPPSRPTESAASH
jgi:hypothetical protein